MFTVTMPQAGQTMDEGVVVRWLKSEGDAVSKGEALLEIETDKANLEVECGAAGLVRKILVPEGATVPVHTPLAYVGPEDEALPKRATPDTEAVAESALEETPRIKASGGSVPLSPPPVSPLLAGGRVKASPIARRIARERGVDLAALGSGRGPGGRIVLDDVHAAAAGATAAVSRTADLPPGTFGARHTPFSEKGTVRRPMSRMRRAIAQNLTLSKQTIPHFYVRGTVAAEALYNFYQEEKKKYACTLNDVVVLACACAMRDFPAFCCRLDEDDFVHRQDVNIGVAVSTDDGLLVPVVPAVQTMTLVKISQETRHVIEAARAGRLDRSVSGTMTVTNLGMFGAEEFVAIINPPEVAILAVGALREGIVVKNRGVIPTRLMSLVLSVDHRVIDGVTAAKFMQRLKELLENPEKLPH